MKDLRSTVKNLIDNFLKIRKDDIVSIASEIYKSSEADDFLVEMEMVEALFLELTRKKAYPLLNITVQKIQEKLKQEFPETLQLVPDRITRNFIETIDSFVEVGWKKLSRQIMNGYETTAENKDPQIFYWHKIFQYKKKITFLNFPTPELAIHIKADYTALLDAYLKSIDCNYGELKKQAEELKDEFFSYANYRISTDKEKLNIKIIKDSFQYFMGSPQDHQVTILPAGVIEFPLDKISLEGVFLAEKVYYRDLIFNNVKLNFTDGVIRYISFKVEDKGNYALQNKIMGSQKECYFSLGFNDRISDYTGFYLYDRCIQGNICLKFFDQDSFPIVFSNIKAEIKKRKRIFMNG
jgi:leucyl aminopeptidase (aminopeptidase T)